MHYACGLTRRSCCAEEIQALDAVARARVGGAGVHYQCCWWPLLRPTVSRTVEVP
jgi:hypothetical protein